MTYKDHPKPGVVATHVTSRGILWAYCEDCGATGPVTKRHGDYLPLMIPHISAGAGTGALHALLIRGASSELRLRWRRARRVAQLCEGTRLTDKRLTPGVVVRDWCDGCPVAVYARQLIADDHAGWRASLSPELKAYWGMDQPATPAKVPAAGGVQPDLFGGEL